MCALPESWNSNNNMKEYAYTVSLPIPINDDVKHNNFNQFLILIAKIK